MTWTFKEMTGGDVRTYPHEQEFFSVTLQTEAIVREAIQNSLDAKFPGHEKVRLRFSFGKTQGGNGSQFILSLAEHLRSSRFRLADEFGLNPFSYLTIEDFETIGLTGKYRSEDTAGPDGNFYNFWRADGRLEKGGTKGGRWGLGKYSFFSLSRIRTFWGLTVRGEDDLSLLMGRSLLEPHEIGSTTYNTHGFFADNGTWDPITDERMLSEFQSTFSLKRDRESGLSIVIPYPREEGGISFSDKEVVANAVIDHYLYNLLQGTLEVQIESNLMGNDRNPVILKKESIHEYISRERDSVRRTRLLKFMEGSMQSPTDLEIHIEQQEKPKYDLSSFDSTINELRRKFMTRSQLIKLRVHVNIEFPSGDIRSTYFDLCMQRIPPGEKSEVICLRSGIHVIDGIKFPPRRKGVRILLLATDPPISEFLGDSENPSHTEWRKKNEIFGPKYGNSGKNMLDFITDSASNILDIIETEPLEREESLLVDIFHLPRMMEGRSSTPGKIKVKVKRKSPRYFNVERIEGGFSITLNPETLESEGGDLRLPARLYAEAAYVVRRGNAFKSYDPLDFEMGAGDIRIEQKGASEISKSKNMVFFTAMIPDFYLMVKGFDRNRDLKVKVDLVKEGDIQ